MKFSIIHPTARVTPNFEHPWWHAAESALYACDSPRDVEYILVIHHSRAREFYRTLSSPGAHIPAKLWGTWSIVINHGRDCLVDQCNAGQLAAQGEIIVGNQDDMRYPEHWDTEISKLIPDTSKLVCVQARTDGGRKDLLTIPTIATRSLVEAIGMLPSEYESMFSDDEWSAKAWRLGSVTKSTLYFQHLHPVNKTANSDAVYALENRAEAYNVGWKTFQERKAAGFPRVPYPGEDANKSFFETLKERMAAILSPPHREIGAPKVIAICTPGAEFPFAWVEAFLNLGSRLGEERFICKRYMTFSSNVYHTRQQLVERVIEDARVSGIVPQLVLWLDSDNVLLPDQLSGLLRFMERYPEVDAVFGWCWIRKPQGWTTSAGWFWPDDGVHLLAMNADAMFEGATEKEKWAPKRIEHSGFPCALIRYAAMEKLGPGAFRPLTKADLPAYFGAEMPKVEVSDDWFSGEDSAWCLRAKKAGMTLVVDPGCKVGHLKLGMQEPDIKGLVNMGFQPKDAEKHRADINGAPVEAPPEYERVIS
jgi:hypothetical protein